MSGGATGLARRLQAGPRDAAMAMALAAPSLAQVLIAPIAARGLGVLVALGSTLPVAWRRTHPAAAALAAATTWLIPTTGFIYLGYVAAFILFYSVAAHVDDARRLAAVVTYGVAVSLAASAIDGLVAGEYFGAVTSVLAPAIVGRVVRRHREQAAALERLTMDLQAERRRGERAAIAEERTRIARELHDVVAHGVSVIAIQSDAAEAALERDPELARAPLRTIRASAREALTEMRRTVGALREDAQGVELAPAPGADQLPALVRSTQAAGVPVAYEQVGQPVSLAHGLDAAVYRIVQEALTNVRKHAPGQEATVRLRWSAAKIEIEVANPLAPGTTAAEQGGGHGLAGIGERVRVHGGRLRAGPTSDDDFVVHVTLPLEARP